MESLKLTEFSEPNRKGKVMAKLRCVLHDKRVQVIEMGNNVALTVHRNGGKQNEICDSRTVTIDGEFFLPSQVITDDWSDSCDSDEDALERYLWFGTASNPIL